MSAGPRAILVAPAAAWLAIAWAWPILLVFAMSLREFDQVTMQLRGYTLEHYTQVLTDPFYLEAFLRSLRIAAITTLLSAILGYPAALHIATMRSQRGRALFTLIVLIPVMLSLVVTAFAWILILGPSGLVSRAAAFLRLSSGPLTLLNTEPGVVIVLVYSFCPYMIMSIRTALEKIDPHMLRAAAIHGARPSLAFYRITLPLSVPGILSGGLMVFALSAAAFVTPYVIGGSRVKVVPLIVYNAAVTTFEWPLAATLSVLLLFVMLALTFAVGRFTERRFAAWLRGT